MPIVQASNELRDGVIEELSKLGLGTRAIARSTNTPEHQVKAALTRLGLRPARARGRPPSHNTYHVALQRYAELLVRDKGDIEEHVRRGLYVYLELDYIRQRIMMHGEEAGYLIWPELDTKQEDAAALALFAAAMRSREVSFIVRRGRYESMTPYQAMKGVLSAWRDLPDETRPNIDSSEALLEHVLSYMAERERRYVKAPIAPGTVTRIVFEMLRKLSASDQRLVSEKFGIGCVRKTTKEIAEAQNITTGAVSNRIRRILDTLGESQTWREHIRTLGDVLDDNARLRAELDAARARIAEITALSGAPVNWRVLTIPLERLDWPARAWSAFRAYNMKFVGDLVQYSESKLCRCRNVGRTTLREIKLALKELGLCLGMAIPDWESIRPRERDE